MKNQTLLLATLPAVAAFALALWYSPPAEACGGTFCDTGPTAMPVDQSGENIIFVMGETTVEAHIQIQYDPTTTAEQFAWVVPITVVPEFRVGSDQLFINTLAGTVPAYGFTTNVESCGGSGDGATSGPAGDSGGGGDSTGGDPGGPEVVYEDTVGAFQIVVLQGGTSAEVMQWLADNQYQQDPAAEPILQEYLDEGYMFAAFRLTNGADTDQIHPVALVFDNDEACIPLRLTRIAALEDMDVRSFFLADHRVVPQNYRHVLVNPLKLDWPNFASNYKSVITMAVDADEANGHAFVTEYAGSSSVVNQAGIFDPLWDAAPFQAVDPVGVIDLLSSQNLVFCYDDFGTPVCLYNHTLIRGLLAQYLPVPAGMDEGEFYGCLACNAAEIDLAAWDGPAFSQAIQERIIDPGLHAIDVLDAYPTLTRMYTTISPGEMTEDPFFYQNADLPDVDLTNQVASRFLQCGGASVWTLPDGREVYVPGTSWPDFPGEMPWEEEVEEIAAAGAPISLVDNTEAIDTMLAEYNCMFFYPSAEACGVSGGSGTGDATEGEPTGGSSGDTAGQQGGGEGDGGCGCSTRPRGTIAWTGLMLLGLLGLRRRRD